MTGHGPVVVGINGPPDTYRQAMAFALREAALRRSAVRLVHGCQPLAHWDLAHKGEPTQEQQRQARRQLRGAVHWARQFGAGDFSIVCRIHRGSGVDALLEESKHAALVVAQRREISGLRRLSAGSTTGAVTAGSQCPVVVVRPDSLLGRAGSGVVVGIADSVRDQDVLRVGFEEATLRCTDLTVITMRTQPSAELATVISDVAARQREHGGWVAGRSLSEALAGYARLFPDVVVRQVADTPAIEDLVTGSTEAELLIVARGGTADGGSTTLPAVAQECVNSATCPVMIVDT